MKKETKSPTNASKNVTDTCPTCGCMVEVVGDVTKHYKPLTLQVTHQDTLQDMKEGKHNHILAPGFEHLPYDAPEAGIATDHTVVENQPTVSEEIQKVLDGVIETPTNSYTYPGTRIDDPQRIELSCPYCDQITRFNERSTIRAMERIIHLESCIWLIAKNIHHEKENRNHKSSI